MTAIARPSFRRIAAELDSHRRIGLAAGASAVVEVTLATAGPLLMATGVTAVVHRDSHRLLVAAVALTAVTAGQMLASNATQRNAACLAQSYLGDLRARLLKHLFDLDLDFFHRERAGRVVARLTSDVESLQQFLENGLVMSLRAGLLICLTLGVLLYQSLLLTTLVVVCVAPLLGVTAWYRRQAFRSQLAVRESNAELLTHVDESLSAAAVIQAFGIGPARRAAFAERNRTLVAAKMAGVKVNTLYQLGLDLLPLASLAAIALGGAVLSERHDISITAAIAAVLYVGRLFEPVQQLSELATLMQTAGAAFAKIFGFLDTEPAITDAPITEPLQPGPGALRILDVSFHYAEGLPDAVSNISIDIAAGERIALVGGSGAGKSTLAKLLARFYEPSEGRILLDGQDTSMVPSHELRQRLALVPQEGYVFLGTVADNIALGRPGSSRTDVERACADLGIGDRLTAALPDGLDTEVTGGGKSLSSGQRQLIALARAFLADPRVLILDEATSHLDPATDQLVEHALGTLLRGRTSIVIAHRVSTALRADRVALLVNGRMVELGRPNDLIAEGGAFARWAQGDDSEPAQNESQPA